MFSKNETKAWERIMVMEGWNMKDVYNMAMSFPLFFLRRLGCLQEVFTLTAYLGRLQEVFTQGYFIAFFFLFFLFSLFFPSFLCFFFLLLISQGVGGVETGTYSTTNTILPRFSMNSCLERGFL